MNKKLKTIDKFLQKLISDKEFSEKYWKVVSDKWKSLESPMELYTIEHTLLFAKNEGFEIKIEEAKEYYVKNISEFRNPPIFIPGNYPSGYGGKAFYSGDKKICWWDFRD